jgi:hypothetical protein
MKGGISSRPTVSASEVGSTAPSLRLTHRSLASRTVAASVPWCDLAIWTALQNPSLRRVRMKRMPVGAHVVGISAPRVGWFFGPVQSSQQPTVATSRRSGATVVRLDCTGPRYSSYVPPKFPPNIHGQRHHPSQAALATDNGVTAFHVSDEHLRRFADSHPVPMSVAISALFRLDTHESSVAAASSNR